MRQMSPCNPSDLWYNCIIKEGNMTNSQAKTELQDILQGIRDLQARLNAILNDGDLNRDGRAWVSAAGTDLACAGDSLDRAARELR